MVRAKKLLNVVVMMVLTLTLNTNADEVCLKAAMVSGGEFHTLVRMENGTVWACGGNGNGQLGIGSEIDKYILTQVHDGAMNTTSGFLEDIIAIDAGWYHSLAVDNINGHVWAWGGDTNGQIGNGSTADNILSPIAVFSGDQNPGNPTAPLSNITCISAGRSGTHSLASQGQFTYAWGSNSSGQCGDGTFTQRDTPVKVKRSLSPVIYLGDGADADIVEVDAGVGHSIARDVAGYVWEWGRNNSLAHKVSGGEMGTTYLENIIEIASCYQSLALSADGNVYQWETGYPVKVPGGQMGTTYLENIVSIGVGYYHFLALDNDGFVWQWTSYATPTKVTTGEQASQSGFLENIIAIDDGYEHRLTIEDPGVIYSWGSNSNGQLGIDSPSGYYDSPMEMICANTGHNFDLSFSATYEGDCVSPDDDVTFTIGLSDPNAISTIVADIVVYLPPGVTFLSADPDTGSYDPLEHSYLWPDVTITPGNSISYTIDTITNTLSNPSSMLYSTAVVSGDYFMQNKITIPVCCWYSGTIYVDAYATGCQNGTNWDNAYTDLQDALAQTATSCGSEIWVARGTYSPGIINTTKSFVVPANVELYGGFAGMETARSQRDHTRYQTILTGYINETTRNEVVVTMGDDSILDGFVVKDGDNGASGDTVDFSISNCSVSDNSQYGIYAANGTAAITWSVIRNNDYDGIYHSASDGSNKSLTIENCKIHNNKRDGINCRYAIPAIRNSVIYANGYNTEALECYGIRIYDPDDNPTIHNDTIAHNGHEGISSASIDSNNAPDIRNCIIWHNNAGDWNQLLGYGKAYYSCVTDPNDPNGIADGADIPDGNGNISANPKFAYNYPKYPRNYHLKADSPCIDKGHDLYVGIEETDIDNGDRIVDWLASTNDVDMGADELSCEDVENVADFNSNGVVNLVEFAMFSDAWLSVDPNYSGLPDPDWNSRCNLDNDDEEFIIDIADLVAFADKWVWTACWRSTSEGIWSMMMAGGCDSSSTPSAMTEAASLATAEVETAPAPELTLEERIAQLTEILNWLEDEISQDEEVYKTITEEQLQIFIDDLLKILEGLKPDDDN